MKEKKLYSILMLLVLVSFPLNLYAKTLNFGVIMALSGSGALWGKTALEGVELAVEDINNKGGLMVGGDKFEIKLITYDDKYVALEAVNAANKLIYDDKVNFIFGSIGSATTLALQEVTEPKKVIIIDNGWNDKILGPNKPYSFRVVFTSLEHAIPTARYAVNKYKIKTAAIAHSSDATGIAVADHFKRAFNLLGVNTVAVENFDRGTTDFYPLLTRIIAKNPDLLFGNVTPTEAPLFVKQARELGFKGKTMSHGGAIQDYDRFVEIAGKENAEGHMQTEDFNYNSKDPKIAKLSKRYEEKYKQKLVFYMVPHWYDTAHALFSSIEKAGSTDTDKVKQMLETSEFEGVFGKWKFEGKVTYGINHQRMGVIWMTECRGGKQVFLDEMKLEPLSLK